MISLVSVNGPSVIDSLPPFDRIWRLSEGLFNPPVSLSQPVLKPWPTNVSIASVRALGIAPCATWSACLMNIRNLTVVPPMSHPSGPAPHMDVDWQRAGSTAPAVSLKSSIFSERPSASLLPAVGKMPTARDGDYETDACVDPGAACVTVVRAGEETQRN